MGHKVKNPCFPMTNLSGSSQWKIACFATMLLSIMLYSGRSGYSPIIFPIAKNFIFLKIIHK